MDDPLDSLLAWLRQDKDAALATVISTWGSAPRQAGAKMAVGPAGEMVGSVSGGCVEAAVAQAALDSLKDGKPRLLHYSVSDEAAWDVGLTCGGQLEVFVEPMRRAGVRDRGDRLLQGLVQARAEGRPVVRAVVMRGPGGLLGETAAFDREGVALDGSPGLMSAALADGARRAAERGAPLRLVLPLAEGEGEVLLDPVLPAPTLVIVGAVHIAVILTRLAKAIGFRVVILDPRRGFATAERFGEADEVLHEWPEEGLRHIALSPTTAVAVVSHDPKLDDPALMAALRSPAGYVGALGSRATNAARRKRLAEAGLTEAEWDRLHAPIGIPELGESPQAIALGILTEIASTPTLRAGLGS